MRKEGEETRDWTSHLGWRTKVRFSLKGRELANRGTPNGWLSTTEARIRVRTKGRHVLGVLIPNERVFNSDDRGKDWFAPLLRHRLLWPLSPAIVPGTVQC
jgi:hypothetical protein